MTDRGRGLIGEYGYLKGDPKDNHPERFPHNPEMDAISRLMFRRDELESVNALLREALRNLVNHLPECEIELAREVWGNTNTGLILEYRREAQQALATTDPTE